ncbi:putative RING-H2 finger protein ATL21A [Neltuma alba]|uniref:putative RING-H2 finger protein ATL21A n=1 Tax=Neltuma alba TaxID=207710 RepID=UPI0010A2CCE3|nr:putative RING-H2 finger protein ATL21A [Prosopis alba]
MLQVSPAQKFRENAQNGQSPDRWQKSNQTYPIYVVPRLDSTQACSLMAHSSGFISVFLFLFLICPTTRSIHMCETYCDPNEFPVQFPFQLVRDELANGSNTRCGYPGFELSCNKSRTMLHLPHAGDFLVDLISYEDQKLWIRDPDNCLPRRFMNNEFNLTDSTFQLSDDYGLMNFTFFNCSSNVTQQYQRRPIPCLSSDLNQNHSVFAVLSDFPFSTPWIEGCKPISSASVPSSIPNGIFWGDLNADIGLQWNTPSCGDCVAKNGRCEFLKNTGLEVACYLTHQGGLSKFAKYGLGFGVGIPGLLSVIGIVYMCKGRRRRNEDGRQSRNIELNNVAGWSSIVVMGLDGESIDKYPMTRIGDSGDCPTRQQRLLYMPQ